MSTTSDEPSVIATSLHEAERTKKRIPQISERHPGMSMDDDYAIQKAWLRLKSEEGRRTVGYKIGLTSRAMQLNAHINEPDYGALLDDMLFAASSDIPMSRFISPLVEVELAFLRGKPLKGPESQSSTCQMLRNTSLRRSK